MVFMIALTLFFAYGCARAYCDDCAHDYFVAPFSLFLCKARGVCPSCNTRRMAEAAAHLTDHVFPHLPVRQWVLSVPKRLRYYIQRDGAVLNMVLRCQMRNIAFITDRVEVRKRLNHIGAESEPPRITPACGPPLWEISD